MCCRVESKKSMTMDSRRQVHLAQALNDCVEECDFRNMVMLLNQEKADPNVLLPLKNFTTLHFAAGMENEDMAEQAMNILLASGGNPNVQGEELITPLHVAASWNHVKVLKVLLDFGADPFVKDECGQTALDYAMENKCSAAVDILTSFIDENGSEEATGLSSLHQRLKKLKINDPQFINKKRRTRRFFRPSILEKVAPISGKVDTPIKCEDVSKPISFHVEDIVSEDEDSSDSITILEEFKNEDVIEGRYERQHTFCVSGKLNTPKTMEGRTLGPTSSHIEHLFPEDEDNSSDCNSITILEELSNDNDTNCKESSLPDSLDLQASGCWKRPLPIIKVNDIKVHNISSTNEDAYKVHQKHIEKPDSVNDAHNTINENKLSRKSIRESLLPRGHRKPDKNTRILSWINGIGSGDPEVSAQGGLHRDNCDSSSIGSSVTHISDSNKDTSGQFKIPKITTGVNSGSESTACSSDTSYKSCASECYVYTDEENGIVLLEERFIAHPNLKPDVLASNLSCTSGAVVETDTETCDTNSMRCELQRRGISYGPITATTKMVYKKLLKKPRQLEASYRNQEHKYSYELMRSLEPSGKLYFVARGSELERKMAESFSESYKQSAGLKQQWREGCQRTSFTYLLLDPRITSNLPWRALDLSEEKIWTVFLRSVFYVGKGKRSRPYFHLYEARGYWNNSHQKRYLSSKVKKILDIWNDGLGVVCLHVFQNVIPAEAFTREAAMIDALDVANLCNLNRSQYHGMVAGWNRRDKNILGAYLLHKALKIFLLEGERHISPWDILGK